jgi:hypothetical protein
VTNDFFFLLPLSLILLQVLDLKLNYLAYRPIESAYLVLSSSLLSYSFDLIDGYNPQLLLVKDKVGVLLLYLLELNIYITNSFLSELFFLSLLLGVLDADD